MARRLAPWTLLVTLTLACGGQTSGGDPPADGGSAGRAGAQAAGQAGSGPAGQGGAAEGGAGQGGAGQAGAAGQSGGQAGSGPPAGAGGQAAGAGGQSGGSGYPVLVGGTGGGDGAWVKAMAVTPPTADFGGGHSLIQQVAVDAGGNILAAGPAYGRLEGTTIDTGKDGGLVVVKLDPQGQLLWSRALPARAVQVGDLALDAAGNAILVGTHDGGLDWGEGATPPLDRSDAFAVSLAGADGSTRWGHSWGSDFYDHGTSVSISPTTGDIVVMGYFMHAVDVGSGPITDSSLVEIHLDDLGQVTTARSYPGASGQINTRARHKASGALVLQGYVYGTATFGTGGTPVVTEPNSFFTGCTVIAEVDPSGANVATHPFPLSAMVSGFAMRPDGGYVVYGSSWPGGTDLGSGTPGSEGQFFVRYGADHAWQWERTGLKGAYGSALLIDPSGDMLLSRGVASGDDLGDGVPVTVGPVASALVRQGEDGDQKSVRLVDGASLGTMALQADGRAVAAGAYLIEGELGSALAHWGWVIVRTPL